MDLVGPRGQGDAVAMLEVDFAWRPHGDGFGQAGLVDMEEGVRAKVLPKL